VSYRPYLESGALRQMHGLPEQGRRVADVGDFGFIVFVVDEAAGLVRVFDLVWTG